MLRFCRITKNASTTIGEYEKILTSENDIDIVVLREPIDRFWAACKTIHPKLVQHKMITHLSSALDRNQDEPHSVILSENDINTAIKECCSKLHDHPIDVHFKKQSETIKEQRFDYVFTTKNFLDGLMILINSGIITIKSNTNLLNLNILNKSIKTYDAIAMNHIENSCLDELKKFYEQDFLYYHNPQVLYKNNLLLV